MDYKTKHTLSSGLLHKTPNWKHKSSLPNRGRPVLSESNSSSPKLNAPSSSINNSPESEKKLLDEISDATLFWAAFPGSVSTRIKTYHVTGHLEEVLWQEKHRKGSPCIKHSYSTVRDAEHVRCSSSAHKDIHLLLISPPGLMPSLLVSPAYKMAKTCAMPLSAFLRYRKNCHGLANVLYLIFKTIKNRSQSLPLEHSLEVHSIQNYCTS